MAGTETQPLQFGVVLFSTFSTYFNYCFTTVQKKYSYGNVQISYMLGQKFNLHFPLSSSCFDFSNLLFHTTYYYYWRLDNFIYRALRQWSSVFSPCEGFLPLGCWCMDAQQGAMGSWTSLGAVPIRQGRQAAEKQLRNEANPVIKFPAWTWP